MNVVESDVAQGLELLPDRWDILEELQRLAHGHIEHCGDTLAFVQDFQRFAVVTPSVTDLAGHEYIGQKVHFDFDHPVARAGLTATTLYVERKTSGTVAAHARFGKLCEQVADVCEQAGVRRWIRTRRAADRCLVDVDHLVE